MPVAVIRFQVEGEKCSCSENSLPINNLCFDMQFALFADKPPLNMDREKIPESGNTVNEPESNSSASSQTSHS